MKLLKLSFDHIRVFKDGIFNLDFFTEDKVPASDESAFELAKPLYVNNVIALAGINASGKTSALNFIDLAVKVIGGDSINSPALPSVFPSIFEGDTNLSVAFWHADKIFILDAVIGKAEGVLSDNGAKMAIKSECVRVINKSSFKKSWLLSWGELLNNSAEIYNSANGLSDWKVLTPEDVSATSVVLVETTGEIPVISLQRDIDFGLRNQMDGLDDILRVFDSRIEHLYVSDAGRAFTLKFFDQDPMMLSEAGLVEALSSGTTRGLALIQSSLKVLKTGGLLLVDEIDNHLNRQLVNVVLDMFTSRETNPKGATLIFTTHYPQLLDQVHRKDNVFFFTVGDGNKSELVKYCSRVKRIENKKSEVFASNYVKGTAPKYTNVMTLKHLVSKAVNDD